MKTIGMSPRNAKTEKQLISLKRDNLSTKDYWILVGEKTVSLTKQRSGQYHQGKLWEIPKAQFNRLIDFYNKDQRVKG